MVASRAASDTSVHCDGVLTQARPWLPLLIGCVTQFLPRWIATPVAVGISGGKEQLMAHISIWVSAGVTM